MKQVKNRSPFFFSFLFRFDKSVGAHLKLRKEGALELGILLADGLGDGHASLLGSSVGHVGANGHSAHCFHTAANHDVLSSRHHRLGGKVEGLQTGAALSVDNGSGHSLGQFGGQHDVAAQVACLCSDLAHAAENHVVDEVAVNLVAVQKSVHHMSTEVNWVNLGQSTIFLSSCCANAIDNVSSVGHFRA